MQWSLTSLLFSIINCNHINLDREHIGHIKPMKHSCSSQTEDDKNMQCGDKVETVLRFCNTEIQTHHCESCGNIQVFSYYCYCFLA